MSFSVSIHPPKTPITAGSGGEAKATLPNVCKMPGPPAPFIPSPLPNIAKSGNSPDGYSTSVKIESEAVAIRGATFQSMGDVASKGTGGGLISANVEGIAKFIPPGTMDVKIEGKNVHLKGDQVLNNCASGGTPPNTGATMMGTSNPIGDTTEVIEIDCKVATTVKKDWTPCQMQQYCAKIEEIDDQVRRKSFEDRPADYEDLRADGNEAAKTFRAGWNQAAQSGLFSDFPREATTKLFYHDCAHDEAEAQGFQVGSEMQPDHIHEIQAGGSATNLLNLRWLSTSVNQSVASVTGTVANSYNPSRNQSVQANCCPA